MTGAGAGSRGPQPARLSTGAALVLVAAVLLVAGLVAVGVAGLVPEPDLGAGDGRVADARAPVPEGAVPAPGLVGVDPVATFSRPASRLPALPGGAFTEVAGTWEVGAEGAEARPAGRDPTVAVAPAPGTTLVQVTLEVVAPGAGVVTSWEAPDRYLALVVDASGRTLSLVRAEGERRPEVLLQARIGTPGGRLVLALRRDRARVRAIANGLDLGGRVVGPPPQEAVVGMVAGPGHSGAEARFADLTVA